MSTAIPTNRVELSLEDVAVQTEGRVLAGPGVVIRGISTDSRGDLRGKLFVALEGERFDGHDFARRAIDAGAAAVLASRPVELPAGAGIVTVADTLDALGALGLAHRRRWGGMVVAIGGSAGKTTTRATTAAALGSVWPARVHWVAGNLNNRIGVPLVLLSTPSTHRAAVVEVGTNVRGEVAQIAAVVEPDVAVLTLVGLEHTEGIGGIDDIEEEEGDLLRALGSGGVAVANGDDARCRKQLEQSPAGRKVTYGFGEGNDYRVISRRPDPSSIAPSSALVIERAGADPIEMTTALLGEPGALAVVAALAVTESLVGRPVDASSFGHALAQRNAREPGRLTPVTLSDGTLVLDDSYNSNPASARASISTAREIADARDARLVLVLGEMRELGSISEAEHRRLGEELGRSRAAALVAVGGEARRFVEFRGVDGIFVDDSQSAAQLVLERVFPGDVVLVKASRGVALERVVHALVQSRGVAA